MENLEHLFGSEEPRGSKWKERYNTKFSLASLNQQKAGVW